MLSFQSEDFTTVLDLALKQNDKERDGSQTGQDKDFDSQLHPPHHLLVILTQYLLILTSQ